LVGPATTPVFDALRGALQAAEPVALATVIDGPGLGAKLLVQPGVAPLGTLGNADLDRVVARDALGELEAGLTSTRHYGEHGEARERAVSVFIESFAPPPHLVIFGAVDFTAALAKAGKLLGYRVTVCDARAVFATVARFPMADEVVNDWPDRYLQKVADELGPRDAVCVLTHDHKFDVPAIMAAARTRVGYIGAMGSRRTHAQRVERLREAGANDEQLARVMSPIGLDIGARTPEETAISICAEIIANRTGRAAPSLRDSSGPIHS
jgi:xanthine dehydrogenase accessory factor